MQNRRQQKENEGGGIAGRDRGHGKSTNRLGVTMAETGRNGRYRFNHGISEGEYRLRRLYAADVAEHDA